MATKKTGGSTKNRDNTIGRRLGIKRFGGQGVNAGEIIVRQRGTKWLPGDNVILGRDHTISARLPGHVKFTVSKGRSVVNVQGLVNVANDLLPSSSSK